MRWARLRYMTCALCLVFSTFACASGLDQSLDEGVRYNLPGGVGNGLGEASHDVPAGGANARLSPLDAWLLAKQNDDTYQAAISSRKSTQALRGRGRAELMPTIQAGYSRFSVTGQRDQPNPLTGGTLSRDLDYDSTVVYVQLKQPLLDLSRYETFRWYEERADKGQAQWQAARQKLANRLIAAWFKVLKTSATLELDQDLAASLSQRVKIQNKLYQHNAGRIIDLRQTRARLKKTQADVVSDGKDLRVARRKLQSLIGTRRRLASVKTSIPKTLPGPLGEWRQRARVHNAGVNAAKAEQDVAASRVERDSSKRWPSLNLVASWKQADSEKVSTLSQKRSTYVIGVQLSIPIFSGGHDSAQVAQSHAREQQAEHAVAAKRRHVVTDVTRHYRQATSMTDRIQDLKSSVAANKSGLKAARKGYEYGDKDNLYLLKAQDKLYQARSKLMQTRLDYIQTRMELQVLAGKHLTTIFKQADQRFFKMAKAADSSH